MPNKITQITMMLLLGGGMMFAHAPQSAPGDAPPAHGQFRHPMGFPPGQWWNNANIAQQLGLTSDQQKKMDEIFEQNRAKLTQLHTALRQQEDQIKPLIEAEQPDEAQIDAQIDRLAQSRAELEKAHSRMLLGMRRVLTQDQWEKLRALEPPPGEHMRHSGPTGNSSFAPPPPRD